MCLLSLLLFNIVIDRMWQVNNNRRCINWGLFGSLEEVDYTGDLICLFSNSLNDMQTKLSRLSDITGYTGLTIMLNTTLLLLDMERAFDTV